MTSLLPAFQTLKTLSASAFGKPSWDLILLLGVAAIGLFYGLSTGRRRIISAILYTYVALGVFPVIPVERLAVLAKITDPALARIGVFSALWLILFFLLGRGKLFSFPPARGWIQAFILSILQAGLLLHILFTFLPPERIKTLAPLTQTLIANPDLRVWWILGPLAVLIIIRRIEAQNEW